MPTLRFTNCRSIETANYRELPDFYHKQMAICARNGFGPEYSTAEEFMEQSEDYVELWDVVDDADPATVLYDAWIYLSDTGNVFHHGTDRDAGPGMIQWGWECLADKPDPACEQLTEDIQDAFDRIDRSEGDEGDN